MTPGLAHGISGGVVASSIDTFHQAQEVTRQYAKTFYFASHALPPDKRQASFALYSFCRYVDNVADGAADVHEAKRHLGEVRRLLEEIYDPAMRASLWSPLQDTIKWYQIPQEYLHALVDGVEMDLTDVRCATFSDLQKYCYHVASVVGLMMTRILQPDLAEALPYAEKLGTAMQLTNILRDVGEDCGMGRVYLPEEEMREWGISPEDLCRGAVTPAFRQFMEFQIARARSFYEAADPGIGLLPNDGSRYCVRLMSILYGRILEVIEQNEYDVFTKRAHVPLPAKLGVAASVTLRRGESPFFLLGRQRRDAIRSLARDRARNGTHALPSL